MSTCPLVSVIIPSFNRAGYLPDSLGCLQAQTLQDFETILVDDGSTDDTAKLIKEQWTAVRYFHQENAGPAAARNHGLTKAGGEFVAFLDSDDLWRPRFLEVMTACLISHPAVDIAFCSFETMNDQKEILPRKGKRPSSGDVTAALFASTFITTPSVLIRRKTIEAVGGFNSGLLTNEDYDLWLRLSLRHRFHHVDEALCLRRTHPGTQSRSGSPVPLIRKARLLERYFAKPEYAAKIPADLAHQRLAKVYFTAGKASHRGHCYAEASDLFRRSLRHRPFNGKVLMWYLSALLKKNGPRNCASGYLDPVEQGSST